MRSPVRPSVPQSSPSPPPAPTPEPAQPSQPIPDTDPARPESALDTLRAKMATVADEFAEGKINRAQFNAMYRRYSEQRSIIERMVERNPETDAWKQVLGVKGQTSFLRSRYEAQTLYYVVYRHNRYEPITAEGKSPSNVTEILTALNRVWSMPSRPEVGLGRKAIDENHWLILASGAHAVTAVVFSLEPSITQARLVRDLHSDFERANQAALVRGWIVPDHMVFPQRALTETGLF